MENFLIFYLIGMVVSLLVGYLIIKAAVKQALIEAQGSSKEVENLLRSILIQSGGNAAKMADVDRLIEAEFIARKLQISKQTSSNKTYKKKIEDLSAELLQKEVQLKSEI